MPATAMKDLPAPKTLFDTVKLVRQTLELAVRDNVIPTPDSGPPGEPGPEGPAGDPGPQGAAGIVARSMPWEPRYYAAGQTVTHLAGLWQATNGTDDEPAVGPSWNCLSRGVIDARLNDADQLVLRYSDQSTQVVGDVRGPPGREPTHKGVFQPGGWYSRSDIVVVRGSSYIATSDTPGNEVPGEGWSMIAQAKSKAGPRGKVGLPGETGQRGAPGADGRSLKWRSRFVFGTIYEENDVVSFGNAIWIALQETTEVPTNDGVNWEVMLRVSAGGGADGVTSTDGSILDLVTLTQAEYDALSPPNPTTLYHIIAEDCTP